MMDTILNLGLNDHRTQILAEQTNPDFRFTTATDVFFKCLQTLYMEF